MAQGVVGLDRATIDKGLYDFASVFTMPRLSSHGGLNWPGTADNSGIVPESGDQVNNASIWHDNQLAKPEAFLNPYNHFTWIYLSWFGPGIEPGLYGQAYRLLGTVGFGVIGGSLWLLEH